MDPAKDGNNWWVYCANNPLRYVDPDGLEAVWWNPLSWNWSNLSPFRKAEMQNNDDKGKDVQIEPIPLGWDLTVAPPGTEWRGPDPQGGARGGYLDPKSGESFHPDLENKKEGPHWDHNLPGRPKRRLHPDTGLPLHPSERSRTA